MGKRSVEITVTARQRVILKRVTRSKKAAQQLLERSEWFCCQQRVCTTKRREMSWASIPSAFVVGDIAGRAR